MSRLMPSAERATGSELAAFFAVEISDLNMTVINDLFPGGIIECLEDIPKKHTGNVNSSSSVFHLSVLQIFGPHIGRRDFFFCRNGTVQSRTHTSEETIDTWEEGIQIVFETALLSLERITALTQETTRKIRNRLRDFERDSTPATQP